MLSLENVRADLKNIRYYFSRKEKLRKTSQLIGENAVVQTVRKYNEAVCKATPKMYELYATLYVENRTQESAAQEFGYSLEYLQRMNKELIEYLQTAVA